MPELPEVEVVRRGLAEHVVGRRLADVSLRGTRVARRHPPGPRDLEDRLRGRLVRSAERRGKYLWLVVEDEGGDADALILHLGMSGQLLVEEPDAPPEKHLHATFDLAGPSGEPARQLRFVDQRTFGGLAWSELVAGGRASGIPESIAHIAPDPLEPAYDQAAVVRRAKARHVAVKRALLDQGLVSGIGNIYADEALWAARIHGRRLGSRLTLTRIVELLDAVREVMSRALDAGGTSFDAQYVNVNGQAGYFAHSLNAYGQQGKPCPRCGTSIVRESFMNRGSHFCPRCQRLRP